MEIRIEHLIEGAKVAKGLVVIIDVFRATTTAAYVMNNGAEKIIPVNSLEQAFEMKRRNPDYILMGERNGLKVKGFDYGNSPFEIINIDFASKTVIMTTSAGTKGIVYAKDANEIILGSFVSANSVVNYIKDENPEIVTLVALGEAGIESTDEDELCAKYIKNLLEGNNPDFENIKNYLKNYNSALKFFDINKPKFPEGDFDCAMDLDRFNFILKVIEIDNYRVIVKL